MQPKTKALLVCVPLAVLLTAAFAALAAAVLFFRPGQPWLALAWIPWAYLLVGAVLAVFYVFIFITRVRRKLVLTRRQEFTIPASAFVFILFGWLPLVVEFCLLHGTGIVAMCGYIPRWLRGCERKEAEPC